VSTLYIWTYDNHDRLYSLFGPVTWVAQIDYRDLVGHNSEAELMAAVEAHEWGYDQILRQVPDRLCSSHLVASGDWLNPERAKAP
jgi:hypothetical protein